MPRKKSPNAEVNTPKHIQAMKAQHEEKRVRSFARPLYTNPLLLAYNIAKYMYTQDNAVVEMAQRDKRGKPYTISGMKAAANFLYDGDYSDYKNGAKDYLIAEQAQGIDILDRAGKIQSFHISQIQPEYIPYILYLMGMDTTQNNLNPLDSLTQDELEELDQEMKGVPFSQILTKYALSVESQRESDLYDKGRVADIFIHRSRYGWQDETKVTFRREIVDTAEARELLRMVAELPQLE